MIAPAMDSPLYHKWKETQRLNSEGTAYWVHVVLRDGRRFGGPVCEWVQPHYFLEMEARIGYNPIADGTFTNGPAVAINPVDITTFEIEELS